jgi:thiol-disulfide isomerase/thioredoxin
MKNALKLAGVLAFAAVTTASITPAIAQENAAITLKAGDAAPAFKVTEWYKGEPVTIDPAKTYILECWATWCGPCIAAFPHLSELAKANKDKITIVGVNVWERKSAEEVKAFIEKQGDKMSYNVVADGDKAFATDWLKAAGQNGIPCAFVVHKGKINWIGHPAQLKQDLLDSIVAGTFDVEAYAKEKEELKQKQMAVANYFKTNVTPLLMEKNFEGAIAKMEEMKKEFPAEEKTIDMNIQRIKAMAEKQGKQ